MGMCASQGRLLTLTALKSDCELQVQKIVNDKETLARQQEALMLEYSDKTSNRKLLLKNNNNNTIDYIDLTYANLTGAGYTIECDASIQDKIKNSKGVGEVNNFMQYALINGLATLKKDGKEVSVAGESMFRETYYDEDDAEAKAKYDYEMKKVQIKESRLDVTLEQIETRHKAYETEISSVQEVIKKNIEGSFNAFQS